MHDLIAELTGYRNELTSAERAGKADRANAVAGEIDRVTGEIEGRVEQLLTEAADYDELGQHIVGAGKREEATRLRRALEVGEPGPAPAAEDAAQRQPRERATPPRGRAATGRRGPKTAAADPAPATGAPDTTGPALTTTGESGAPGAAAEPGSAVPAGDTGDGDQAGS